MKKKKLILEINSLGRFSMSPWKNNFYEIKNTKKQNIPDWIYLKKKQEKILIDLLKKKLKKKKYLTVHDVGCNDGYFTEKIASLNFKTVIGSEPREDTLLRGKKIRKLLKIKTRAKYIVSKIDNIKQKYASDVVTCCGVLHHTNNIEKSFIKLLKLTKKFLIVEGEFLPSSLMKNREINSYKQIKDIFYKQNIKKNNFFSISINKFESNFLDGSNVHNGLVETPTPSKLIMISYLNNFKLIFYNEKKFKNFLNTNRCIMIFERKDKEEIDFSKLNIDEEESMFTDVISLSTLKKLSKKKQYPNTMKKHKKIVNNFKYNFNDKINFEYAKTFFFLEKDIKKSKIYLEKIIYKKNADWFSCYKSFALLSIIDKKNQKNWKKRLFSCNPNFPKSLLKNLNNKNYEY